MTTGRRWSLSRRVALVAVIVLAGWVVVLTVGVNLVVSARLAEEADDLLRTEAQLTADTIEIGPDRQLIIQHQGCGARCRHLDTARHRHRAGTGGQPQS